jgi:hypothetical protein
MNLKVEKLPEEWLDIPPAIFPSPQNFFIIYWPRQWKRAIQHLLSPREASFAASKQQGTLSNDDTFVSGMRHTQPSSCFLSQFKVIQTLIVAYHFVHANRPIIARTQKLFGRVCYHWKIRVHACKYVLWGEIENRKFKISRPQMWILLFITSAGAHERAMLLIILSSRFGDW